MATPAADVREFCALLVKSRLVPAGEVEALHRKWKAETGGTMDQVDAFGKYLVGKQVLTPWQAALVRRGRAAGFFLGGYKILEQLGKGQMGGVYKAVHSLGQVVALKILPASRAKDDRARGRFQREARLLTQLDHPNVVRAFQVGEAEGRQFIVMEYVDGETLAQVLARRTRLPVGEAVRVVRQALDGLQHLHEKRMVHRDLKPANLMLTPAAGRGSADTTAGATVKVLDIGLGRGPLDAADGDATSDAQFTGEGAVVGTPDYMAPEQAKDARAADVRADVYSLGCVLFHCLTGRPPFTDTNIMTQMLRHATDDPPPLADLIGDVPRGLQGVLDTLLAKHPGQRFQTPAAAAAALKPFQEPGIGVPPSATQVVPAFQKWLATDPSGEAAKLAAPPPAAPVAPVKPASVPVPPPAPKPPPSPIPPTAWADPPAPAAPAAPSPYNPYSAGAYLTPAAGPSPQPAAAPAAFPLDDVEVELVTFPSVDGEPPAERPIWELDRRDAILLAAGGFGVLGAVGLGYGLSRLVRALTGTPNSESPEEK